MGIPQIVFIAYYGLDLFLCCLNHGKEKQITLNLGHALLSLAVTFGLLIWGGFFGNGFAAPQVIVCVFYGLGLLLYIILDGTRHTWKSNAFTNLVSKLIILAPLYFGGFFAG